MGGRYLKLALIRAPGEWLMLSLARSLRESGNTSADRTSARAGSERIVNEQDEPTWRAPWILRCHGSRNLGATFHRQGGGEYRDRMVDSGLHPRGGCVLPPDGRGI